MVQRHKTQHKADADVRGGAQTGAGKNSRRSLRAKSGKDGSSMSSSKDKSEKGGGLIRVASFIVDKRMLFFLIYIIAVIFSMVATNWVQVNNTITDYLPESTETRLGLDLMEEEFTTYGSAKVMVSNISFEEALEVQEIIEDVDGVNSVTFTEEDADQEDFLAYYNDGAALFSISFDYPEDDDRSLESLALVEEAISSYDYGVSTEMGNQTAETIDEEISKIMVLVVFVVVGVLLLTTMSLGEIPVLCITFVVSMVLNKGTNFLCGEISFISNSVSAILQLALSVDYAIIFVNRYKEELANGYDVRDATVVSLAAAIPEILSSSLTTICGLFAMTFMQFTIGLDMGIVLIKSILFSLLTVFTLMPGLIVVFSGLMEKTRHRNLVPKISFIGKFDYKLRHVITALFIGVFVVAFALAQNTPYVYGYTTLETFMQNDQQKVDALMEETFGSENYVAVVVPHGDYETEAQLIADIEARDDVDYAQGLANTEAMDGYVLTDTLTPREFSELLDLDYELAELLYTVYAADQEDYGRIVGGISSYEIMLMDIFEFVYEMVDDGYVSLDDELGDTLETAYDAIVRGRAQLEGDNYDRILVYLSVPLPEQDEGTFDTVEELHNLAASYYIDEEVSEVYVVGDSTSQRDLKDSFDTDNIIVTVVSMLFVLIVLLFTFKSAGLPVLLILVIEGAISLNFGYLTLADSKLFFIAYLIVSSIQMGANIDYAIVISSRYTEERKQGIDRQTAVVDSLNCAFPTIVTSGSMMVCAGLFIGFMTSDACIAGIGQCLARGTAISIVLVLFVLPALLACGDRIIEKTTFDIYRPVRTREAVGEIRIDGTVRGTINGTVIGTMNAVVRGEANVVVVHGDMNKIRGDAGKDAAEDWIEGGTLEIPEGDAREGDESSGGADSGEETRSFRMDDEPGSGDEGAEGDSDEE